MMELVCALAVLGIIAAISLAPFDQFEPASHDASGLEAEVTTINHAVDTYLANGGSLAGVLKPQGVLDKIVPTSGAGVKTSHFHGRMKARMQTATEAASHQPRAVWNSNEQKFEIKTAGLGGVRNFSWRPLIR